MAMKTACYEMRGNNSQYLLQYSLSFSVCVNP
jgi:hypothetical protein